MGHGEKCFIFKELDLHVYFHACQSHSTNRVSKHMQKETDNGSDTTEVGVVWIMIDPLSLMSLPSKARRTL